MTGTLRLAIDPKFFGRISRVRLPATLERSDGERCRASAGSSRTVTLIAGDISDAIEAIQQPNGRSLVAIDTLDGPLVTRVLMTDALSLFGGPALFSVSATLDSAHLGGRPPLATGGLTFTRDPACEGDPGGGAGQLQGSLTLHFDTRRTVTLHGGDAGLSVGDGTDCGETPLFAPELRAPGGQPPPYVTTRSVSTPTMNPALTISSPSSR